MAQGRNQQVEGLFQQLEDKIDFNQLLSMIVLNKWLIALCAGVCLLLGVAHIAMKPFTYSANLLLQIGSTDFNSDAFSKISALAGKSGVSPEDVQTVLIKSPYVLDPVVRQLG